MTEEFKRKLTAILSADVAGYSRLMDDDEEATIRTLKEYRSFIAETVKQYRGRVVDSPGDNILAEFSSVVDAVKCAVEIQQELHDKNAELTDDRKMQFRIGINLGDVVEEDDRIYGDGVNIAARVESFADAGGICISCRVYEQIENKLDFEYEYLGEKTAKNIKRPIRVYRIPVDIKVKKDTEESILDSIIDMSVPTDKPSIAVLPFVNMSGDPEQEYFSDGMTEAIITALAKIPDIFVISSTSTFTYKGQRVKIQQVGKELGVKYVLEGSFQKAGNRIRLTAQFIEAETGNHLWADRYDRDLKDIFELQDELTTRILGELSVKLWHNVKARLGIKSTNNLEAYLKAWEGLEYLNRYNKKDSAIAYQKFKEAIKLDPNYGAGYAFLAGVHITDFWGGWSSPQEQSIQKAVEYSKKAHSLDNTLPEPYSILSGTYLIKRRFSESIAEAEKAIAVQPSFFLGYLTLGYVLTHSGESEKAKEEIKKAIRLSPKHPLNIYYMGIVCFNLRQYSESITFLKATIEMMPDSLLAHVYLAASYILSEMIDKARNQSQEILRIDPQFSIDNYADRLPYKNQSDTDRILNALRKAGLK